MKRFLILLLALVLLLVGCGPNGQVQTAEPVQTTPALALPDSEGYGLSVAVLYHDGTSWQDTRQLLEQSVLLSMTVDAVDVAEGYALDAYDLVIPDPLLVEWDGMEQLSTDLMAFTHTGGYVLLDNCFSQVLPMEYLGISGTSKLEEFPQTITFPELGEDLTAVQEVVEDYAALYPEFHEAQTLLEQDYGYSVTADTAQVLAAAGTQALYTYQAYGDGGVLLTNPLLPNRYSLGNFSMTRHTGEETAFSSTTASCNQLLYSRFAGYVCKQRYGYALNRVFGYHGSPSMAWELHYEEITGIANNAMGIFGEICRQAQQIPSYTLIRSSYWWFLRTETVTYLRNQAAEGYAFAMDYEESAYSSGTHIVSDGQWLHLSKQENAGSYFREYPEYNYRAYPCIADIDDDGQTELLSGSQDGYFYVYDDLEYQDRLYVSPAQRLTDEDGLALQVAGFSSPQAVDLDGDGIIDLLSGSQDGKIYWYRGLGDGVFASAQLLLDLQISGQTLPALGDLNGDGVPDLAVGSDQGILMVYYAEEENGALSFSWKRMESYSRVCADAGLGSWLAPAKMGEDLAVGTFDGYIAILSDGAFTGYLDIEEQNYKGNHHVKFGNYCVPCFWDIDGDGAEDLVCGSLEYGLAYPIDSEYFPYRAQLEAQLDWAQHNHLYVGVHHYSNAYASAAREAYELRRHQEAFDDYGLEFAGLGVNSHTWYTSNLGDAQTLMEEYRAGLLWNSGFGAPWDIDVAPQYAAENVIALPFFLQENDTDTILVQNCSVLPYADSSWSAVSAKYAMPVCIFYHCDFVYESEAGARDYVQKVSDFQYQYGYNFMREDQLMKASAAAYNLEVSACVEDGILHLCAMEQDSDGSLYDAAAQGAIGVEVDFAQDYNVQSFQTDAKVWHKAGNRLYVSLCEPVTIGGEESSSPLRQVNLPAQITVLENGARISFQEDGMMQVVTPRGYTADTACTGWTVTEQGEQLVFTKFGSADTLQIRRDSR